MRTLRNYYLQGLVLYPRVENGYIRDSLFSYFPHPELKPINNYLKPLKEDSYKLTDDSLLLYLHNLRYFNISNCESVQSFIKGKIINRKPKLSDIDKQLINNYNFFLNIKDEIDLDYFLKIQLKHYKEQKPTLLEIDYTKENFIDGLLNLRDKINNVSSKLETNLGISTNTKQEDLNIQNNYNPISI